MTLFSPRHPAVSAIALAALLLSGLPPARAQMNMPGLPGSGPVSTAGPMGAINSSSHGRGGAAPAPTDHQPDALPGAKAATPAAPATKLATDMAPNEALFDAINRGDLAAARDALNRGADMTSQNILGMTALDLSVDLGRNDITFLLLSMRTDEKHAPGPAANAVLIAKQAPSKAPAAKAVKVSVAEPAPMAPRLFANDGGTPNPAAGFLGFDVGRAAR